MFYAIIHQSQMSRFEKMTHLQQNVVGKAKAAISGFWYNGRLYHRALKVLEDRFGKPNFVIQAHLDSLMKLQPVTEGDPNSVHAFSSAINNIAWTFEELGYDNDLRASTNVKVATQKLPQAMLLKWNEHVIKTRINRPNLSTFRDWLQGQADAHDFLPRKMKEEKRNERKEKPRNTSLKSHEETSHDCPLADGQHAVVDCPAFSKMEPDERAETAKNAQLCFRCLKPGHISRKCSSSKECGIDDCKKKHHKLIHGAKQVYGNSQIGEHCSTSSSNGVKRPQVLLQVLPVTLHGPAASIDTHAMLDMGSTCSLIRTDIARKAGLRGPKEKMTLNGIQQKSVFTSQNVGFQISPVGPRRTPCR